MTTPRQQLDPIREANKRRLWALYHAQQYAKDPGPLAQKINLAIAKSGLLQNVIVQRFASAGGSSGTPWASLKAATVKQRAKLGFGPTPILVRSGTLKNAAMNGKVSATADTITMAFADGPAPRYAGGGRSQPRWVDSKARAANAFFGTFVGASGSLSDYAGALHKKRPFYAPLNARELGPLLVMRDRYIAAVVAQIASGHGVSSLFR